jgi:hypothetical protein
LALDFLEAHVLDRLEYIEERGDLTAELERVRTRARDLQLRLEARCDRAAQRLRSRILSGRYTREGLRRAFAALAARCEGGTGYDALDRLTATLLAAGAPSPERAVLTGDMVRYQPTPTRAILSMIDETGLGPDDVFYDLGSGLGHVVLLVGLLTGARARGIEIEPAYCDYARRSAQSLALARVEIVEADARDASLSGGTVYFLYTPFRGALLDEVLEALRREARQRPIRVCTYGPCTAAMASVPWLHAARLREDGATLFVTASSAA